MCIRDSLNQITRLLDRLEQLSTSSEMEVDSSMPIYIAPKDWTEFAGTEKPWMKKWRMQCTMEQIKVLEGWTPDNAVPPFHPRANGDIGTMNFLAPAFEKKDKNQSWTPALVGGIPNHDNLDEFLKIRSAPDGQPVLDKFYPRIDHGNGHVEYVSREMTEDFRKLELRDQWQPHLPTKSDGPHSIEGRNWLPGFVQGTPQWETMFHGLKMGGVYSTASTFGEKGGGINASADYAKGHRYLTGKPGTYFHTVANHLKARNYSKYEPVFADGTYVAVWVEARCDRSWRVSSTHPDQKIQTSNQDCTPPMEGTRGGPSIFLVSIHFHHVGYQDLPAESHLSMVWSPLLEIPPEHVVRSREEVTDEVSACLLYTSPSPRDLKLSRMPSSA